MEDELEEKQQVRRITWAGHKPREEKALLKRVWAKMSDVSERSNEVRAEKPFLFQWSGRASS